jgi:hypothetical protein
MTASETLALRREELARRVEGLPTEVDGWRQRSEQQLDMNAHFSQIQALEILVAALVARQRELLVQLDPQGDPEGFRTVALDLVREIIRSQKVWDFFRDKLELRFAPDFKDVLWVADTVAWDCYRPVMDRAVQAGILPAAQVREPPLTYLTAEFSPATWVRGSRPNDGRDYHLGTSRLPIPVIEIPWDHIGNLWELVSLQHEVGHDLEADLKLRPALLLSLRTVLSDAGVPQERVKVWASWEGEIFADLIGLQLGGPAFAHGLMHLLLLPALQVTTYNAEDPHPTHYVRILMNAAYMRELVPGNDVLLEQAKILETTWLAQYGGVAGFQSFAADFPHVFRALMETPMSALKGQRVRDLVPYTPADDTRIRAAANYLLTGMNAPTPLSTPPRHCVSGARLAAAVAVQGAAAGGPAGAGGASGLATLSDINQRLIQLVRDNAAPGLRAGDMPTPHRQFIAGFAELV